MLASDSLVCQARFGALAGPSAALDRSEGVVTACSQAVNDGGNFAQSLNPATLEQPCPLAMSFDVELVGLVFKEGVVAADDDLIPLWLMQGDSSSARACNAGSQKAARVIARIAELIKLVPQDAPQSYLPDDFEFLLRLVQYLHFGRWGRSWRRRACRGHAKSSSPGSASYPTWHADERSADLHREAAPACPARRVSAEEEAVSQACVRRLSDLCLQVAGHHQGRAVGYARPYLMQLLSRPGPENLANHFETATRSMAKKHQDIFALDTWALPCLIQGNHWVRMGVRELTCRLTHRAACSAVLTCKALPSRCCWSQTCVRTPSRSSTPASRTMAAPQRWCI